MIGRVPVRIARGRGVDVDVLVVARHRPRRSAAVLGAARLLGRRRVHGPVVGGVVVHAGQLGVRPRGQGHQTGGRVRGFGRVALAYVVPSPASRARFGHSPLASHVARSEACSPSTLIRSTCLLGPPGPPSAPADPTGRRSGRWCRAPRSRSRPPSTATDVSRGSPSGSWSGTRIAADPRPTAAPEHAYPGDREGVPVPREISPAGRGPITAMPGNLTRVPGPPRNGHASGGPRPARRRAVPRVDDDVRSSSG